MTDGSTFLRPKQAAQAARQLTTIAEELERKLKASTARIRAVHARGSQVWGDDEPGDVFVKNYNRGGDGAANATLEAATRYSDVLIGIGPIVTQAVDGSVDVDEALGEAIKKLTGQPAGPPPEI